MSKIRALGVAVATAGFLFAGAGMASADVSTVTDPVDTTSGSATGSANFATLLNKLLSTGSGDPIKPKGVAEETGSASGSANFATLLAKLLSTGSGNPIPPKS
ncbi:hypothetical protein [Nocardia sp. NPDC051832]|uniref:hypothetical protein n=1 Tax=Nocardia sp. NPDC051832 TaxID=3155673 RepID=UPI003446F497